MNSLDFDSEPNIYFCVMKHTMQNLYNNCQGDEKNTLDLLWNSWKTKMQDVIVHTFETGMEQPNLSKRNVKPKTEMKLDRVIGELSNKLDGNHLSSRVVHNKLNKNDTPSLSMPCLLCDNIADSCLHLSSTRKDNTIPYEHNVVQNPRVSNFCKIKLFRPLTLKSRYKNVKIILPVRPRYVNEARTCRVRVPIVLRSSLKSLLTPLISKVGKFSTSRAAVMIQNYINNTSTATSVSQIDGASDDISCKIHLVSKRGQTAMLINRNLDCSDIDSEDDLTDNENTEDTFHSKNNIACLFDSVHHKRNTWKLELKHCVMRSNGQDYVFHKAECVTTF